MSFEREANIAEISTQLELHNLLPAIVFRTARAQCDADVIRAARNRKLHLPSLRQRNIRNMVHSIIDQYEMESELITTHPHYAALIQTGVGAHHAGQLLLWRLMLEELMARGELRVLVATGTVAAGVDFPARTVVMTAHSRRGSDGYRKLTSSEFQQMSGRAGRRGKDTVGFCLFANSMFCDPRELAAIAGRSAEPLESSYFPSASTVLNLLRYRNVDDLKFTVERSLAAYADRREASALREKADKLKAKDVDDVEEQGNNSSNASRKARKLRNRAKAFEKRQATLLEKTLDALRALGHVEGSLLSEKGFWAANLCTNLVLEIAEIVESGMLEDCTTTRLVAVVGSLCGDQHRNYLKGNPEGVDKDDYKKLEDIIALVADKDVPGNVDTRVALPNAAFTVQQWMAAESWQSFRSLLLLAGVAEGDAARLITQTAEHLNQICRLEDSHQKLVYRAEEAKRLLLRPPLSDDVILGQAS